MPEAERVPLYIPSTEQVIAQLEKLPSVLTENEFTKEGFVKSKDELLVPAYVASGLGFNTAGKHYLDKVVYPTLRESGILPLCPFTACGEYLGADVFDQKQSVEGQQRKWTNFNRTIGFVNYGVLMPRAKFLFALMEGYPTDEGVAAEVAYFASNFGPVIGVRTDFRLAENPATGTNPAVTFFMNDLYKGNYFEGQDAYGQAFYRAKQLAREILNQEATK